MVTTVSRPKILEAIRSLGLRVTAADVATKTGLPLNAVIRELNQIAADTQAVLQVSKTGTIAYAFPSDPEAIYLSKGLNKRLKQAFHAAWNVLSFVVRCSFGILLIGSLLTLLVIFVVAIVLTLFAADAADGGDGDLDMADGLDFNFFDVVNLSMFFTWWRHDVQGEINYYGTKIDVRERGFVSHCFSFLFGDGNPNRDFEENAWKNVADIIRLSNGVITAEQVSPYLVDCGADDKIFPVLVRFDGIPEVTPTGNIVYVFPSMQITATRQPVFWNIPAFAEQAQWKFTNIATKKLDLVFYFAGANMAGWFAVAGNVNKFPFLNNYHWLIEILLTYAVFFVFFPMVRSIYNAVRNALVDIANGHRQRNAQLLAQPKAQQKMQEAQAYAVAMQQHRLQDVYYSTARDIDEQKLETDAEWLQANSKQPTT